MADKKDNFMTPPVWKIETTSYEDWKFDVDLWKKFTQTEKARQGFALYSTLPNESGVNEKIRLAMQNEEIKIDEEDSVDQIFGILDKWYKKDDLSVVCEAWSTYKNLSKKETDTMDQFLSDYEKKTKELKKQGIVLPVVVMAMQLIDSAGLDKKDKQIVLTAVDYSKKEEMYEQMKSALRKFFGEQAMAYKQRVVAEDSVNATEAEDVNYTRGRSYGRGAGYAEGRGRRWYGTGRGAGRGSRRGSGRGTIQGVSGGQQEGKDNRNLNNRGQGTNRGRSAYGNPLDADGNYLKCFICESIRHLKINCPHAYANRTSSAMETTAEDTEAEAYKVHDYSHEDKQVLMTEAAHAAVLDSACTKTVAGCAWRDMYIESLSAKEKKQVRFLPGGTNFKFGGGNSIKSEGRIQFPCTIAGQKTTITTDVVDSDIPLLLSKPDMKRLGFKLNMTDDSLEVNGNKIELDTTSSGHYYVSLKECEVGVENVHMMMEQKSHDEKEKMIKKLHRQFAHPTAQSLKAIMKNAEVFDDDCNTIIQEISSKCDVCKRFKKTPARPVVCMPMAKQFNDVVAMDLKKYGDIYFLHFIDLFTRFSKSKVIRRKTPKVIVNGVATEWIASGFGPPKKFLTDNGGEFDNPEYRELAEQFNVEVCATAAYSPWSNGICERNHYVVDTCVQKMMEEDPHMEIDVALAWAVNAKNSMQNHSGFSPIQLVLGTNPNLPSVMMNKPPALEHAEVSDTVIKHLNALHAARRAFAKAESSERIRRALRHNIRVPEVTFITGDRVFYKRDDSNKWRGPGKVIGQDGKIVFIRHGGQLVRVATCRIIKSDSQSTTTDEDLSKKQKVNDSKKDNIIREEDIDEDTEQEQHPEDNGDVAAEPEEPEAVSDQGNVIAPQDTIAQQSQDPKVGRQEPVVDIPDGSPVLQDNGKRQQNQQPGHVPQNQVDRIVVPKVNDRIKYRLKDDEQWTTAIVKGRGGKATGKNKYYMNVVNEEDNQMKGIHLDRTEYEIEDSSEEQSEQVNVIFIPIKHHDKPEVIKAKEQELENWRHFNVFKEVPDKGQKTISTRWVVSEKTLSDGVKGVKARLVVRGFEEDERVQSDSPTASKSSLRIAMAIISSEGWKCESIDIKAAFLQGNKIDRDIFIKPPIEVKEDGIIWKLDKAAYGLGDASRNWYFSVRENLLKSKCQQSELDKALFRWYNQGKLEGVFVMHVDDFLFAGTEAFSKSVIEVLVSKYKVGKRQITSFRYVGLDVTQDEGQILVNQDNYAGEIAEIPVTANRKSDKSSPLNKQEMETLRATAGQLNWIATQTRPDLSYEALELNMTKNNATVEQLVRANKAIRHAKSTKGDISFPKLGEFSSWKMDVFCDASWGNLPDGVSSAQGHVIFLTGENHKSCPLAWTSNKIKRKVSSTLAAETLAMEAALDEAVYLGTLLTEIYCNSKVKNNIPITVYTDNKSLHENIHSTKQVHEKRLRINIAEIQRMLASGEVRMVEWIPSKLQLADCLTKRGVDSEWLLECFNTGELITG